MTYEFCLEYGSYPLKDTRHGFDETVEIPNFVQENQELKDRLDRLNDHFHQLFLVIESQYFFVGHDKPEILTQVKKEHQEIVDILTKEYPGKNITIEKFYWE